MKIEATNAPIENTTESANDARTASPYEARTMDRTAGSRSSSESKEERTFLAI